MLNHLFTAAPPPEVRFNVSQPAALHQIAVHLRTVVGEARAANRDIIVVCIGTDRSTGDCLGPLTGSKLLSLCSHPYLYGTLDFPVHATNLPDTLSTITAQFNTPFVIAVDACLGRLENVGCVSIGRGPIKPGAAVNKKLPPVGDAHVTGIVNVGGFMEQLVLQSTRLNLVMKMADSIAYGLAYGLRDQ